MFKNYIKITFRNLWRNKIFSTINLAGLTLGITVCLLIFQYIFFELSYDRYHRQSQQIYRIADITNEIENHHVPVAPVLAPTLKAGIPEIADFTRLYEQTCTVKPIQEGEVSVFNEPVYYVDPNFFKIFDFPIIQGNDQKLTEPNNVWLSRSYAEKYFARVNVIGERIILRDRFGEYTCTVQGVYEDVPENSHFHPPFVLSMVTMEGSLDKVDWADMKDWGWGSFYTYLLIPNPNAIQTLSQKINQLAKNHDPYFEKTYTLQALKDIHLSSHLNYELEENGHLQSIIILSLVGLFIIIIAWINYINLATARSVDRAKEVGIRKVVGAHKAQLVFQFLFESFLLNTLALILALGLWDLLQGFLYQLTESNTGFSWTRDYWGLIGLGLLFMLGALLSGLYPAFILSAYKPIKVLKGSFKTSRQGVYLRKALVVFQFSISILLISSTYAAFSQMNYMQNKDLGMNAEHLLVIYQGGPSNANKHQIFQEALEDLPHVDKVATSRAIPGLGYNWGATIFRRPEDNSDKIYKTYNYYIDGNFINTYEMELIAGKDGKAYLESHDMEEGLLMNETATRALGFSNPAEAAGKKLKQGEKLWDIVGVVKDYHHQSLREKIDPILFILTKKQRVFSVRINTGDQVRQNIAQTLAQAEIKFRELFPQTPFAYKFVDQVFAQKYKAEQRFSGIFTTFSLIAIFIACLGLFGLASFSATQRTKEIGIRKILGASVAQILMLLSKEYLWLIIWANIIAIPLAYWSIQWLLNNYAYRTSISIAFFFIPALLIVIIALLSVSYQTIKSARANPVEALKYE